VKKTLFFIFIFCLSGLLGFLLSLHLHNPAIPIPSPSDVQTIQTYHYPATFVKQLVGDPLAGEKIFKEFCSACHANPPAIPVHAPLIGDKEAWKYRSRLGVDGLLKITINGAGAMPARGGCFECSDEQLRETVQYILNNS